jgi:hypothetical protein
MIKQNNRIIQLVFFLSVFLMLSIDTNEHKPKMGTMLQPGKDLDRYTQIYDERCGRYFLKRGEGGTLIPVIGHPHLVHGKSVMWDITITRPKLTRLEYDKKKEILRYKSKAYNPKTQKWDRELSHYYTTIFGSWRRALENRAEFFPNLGFFTENEQDQHFNMDERYVTYYFDLVDDKKVSREEINDARFAVLLKYIAPAGLRISAVCFADQYRVHSKIILPQAKSKEYFFTIPYRATQDGQFHLTIKKVVGQYVMVNRIKIYRLKTPAPDKG